jgi:hypothetical protein
MQHVAKSNSKKKKLDEFIMVAKEATDDNKSMGIVQMQVP